MEGGERAVIDLDKTTTMLEPENISKGGLYVPGKDRVLFKPPEQKSVLGLDRLASAKRASMADEGFKVPQERSLASMASLDVDEKFDFGVEDDESDLSQGGHNYTHRRYRESYVEQTSHTESKLTQKGHDRVTYGTYDSDEHQHSTVTSFGGSSKSFRSQSPIRHERDTLRCERRESRGDARSERKKHSDDREERSHGRESLRRYTCEQKYHGEFDGKRRRDEYSPRRISGKSDWDDGRWEWEDTPKRDSPSRASRHHRPSPSPMLVGASPDARLVSPWLGGHTPHFSGPSTSPWDRVSPSPVVIRASGSSARSANSRLSGRSHQLTFSSGSSQMMDGVPKMPSEQKLRCFFKG